MGWRFSLSEKTVRKFAELRIAAAKNAAPHCTGDISAIGLFTGVPQRGSLKPVNCIHTQFSDMLFIDIENK